MSLLSKHRAAVIATDGFEELELTEPLRALRTEGAQVDILSIGPGPIQGMYHRHKTLRVHVDRVLGETVRPEQYDSLVLPGGPSSANALRTHPLVRDFILAMNAAEKPIAAIGHAARLLIAAGIVAHRKITSIYSLRDEVLNAGAYWADEPLVIDENIITAGNAKALAAFDSALIEIFSRRKSMISPETRHLLSRSRFA